MLALPSSLRGALRLPEAASMQECADVAARNTEAATQLSAQARLLCDAVQVRSVESLVPAVNQLVGRSGTGVLTGVLPPRGC